MIKKKNITSNENKESDKKLEAKLDKELTDFILRFRQKNKTDEQIIFNSLKKVLDYHKTSLNIKKDANLI